MIMCEETYEVIYDEQEVLVAESVMTTLGLVDGQTINKTMLIAIVNLNEMNINRTLPCQY